MLKINSNTSPKSTPTTISFCSTGGDLVPSLGGRKRFSLTKISEWRFLGTNFNFHAQNFWWPFFSHRHVFQIFPIVFQFFRIFTVFNVIHDPFQLQEKNPISGNNSLMTPFLLCSCFRAHSTNTTSLNIGGTEAWAVPPPQILVGPSLSPLP